MALTSIDIVNYAGETALKQALPAIVGALGKQLALHAQTVWGRTMPTLHLVATPQAHVAPLAIFENADQANALGYHDETPQGLPYGRVFAHTILANGGSVCTSANSISVTLSHELLEMVGDPAANQWADHIDGYSYALELGDPVEDDAYLIDGVYVSNFVLPDYFDPHAPAGTRLDWLHRLSRPFTMTRGGYLIRRSANGAVSNIFGSEFPKWKREVKAHPAARTVRRMQKPHLFPAERGYASGKEVAVPASSGAST